jgi:hypothetical protein
MFGFADNNDGVWGYLPEKPIAKICGYWSAENY